MFINSLSNKDVGRIWSLEFETDIKYGTKEKCTINERFILEPEEYITVNGVVMTVNELRLYITAHRDEIVNLCRILVEAVVRDPSLNIFKPRITHMEHLFVRPADRLEMDLYSNLKFEDISLHVIRDAKLAYTCREVCGTFIVCLTGSLMSVLDYIYDHAPYRRTFYFECIRTHKSVKVDVVDENLYQILLGKAKFIGRIECT